MLGLFSKIWLTCHILGGRNKPLIAFIGTPREEKSGDWTILTQGSGTISKMEEAACSHETMLLRCVCEIGEQSGVVLCRGEVWEYSVFQCIRRYLKCSGLARREKSKCGWSLVWKENGEAADGEGAFPGHDGEELLCPRHTSSHSAFSSWQRVWSDQNDHLDKESLWLVYTSD